jgi:hypothetical protein
VLVGTDTGLGGFRYHDELQWLRQAGLSQADVLRSYAAGRASSATAGIAWKRRGRQSRRPGAA